MKRVMLTIMVAAAAFSACTNETEFSTTPVGSNSEITFEAPIVAPATRAANICDGVFPTDWGFTVWAKWHQETYDNWNAGTTYMDAVTCARVDASQDDFDYVNAGTPTTENTFNQAWKPVGENVHYYWPKVGVLSFRAVYPTGTNETVWAVADETESNTGEYLKTREDYTFKFDGTQPDLMYSDLVKDKTGITIPNTGVADGTPWNADVTRHSDGVQLPFHHALSNILFQVKLAKQYPGTRITLSSIKLQGMHNKGTFTFSDPKRDGNAENPEISIYNWKPVTESETPSVTTNDYEVMTTNVNSGVEITNHEAFDYLGTPSKESTAYAGKAIDLLVMPQEMTNDVKLVITYYIWTPAYGTYVLDGESIVRGLEQTKTVTLNALTYKQMVGNSAAEQEQKKWFEEGKKYTYNITFSLDEIYFSPEVTNWEDVTVSDITN